MHRTEQRELGIYGGRDITKRLYEKVVESLKEADFMSVYTSKLQYQT
jgi:hypothetical protein